MTKHTHGDPFFSAFAYFEGAPFLSTRADEVEDCLLFYYENSIGHQMCAKACHETGTVVVYHSDLEYVPMTFDEKYFDDPERDAAIRGILERVRGSNGAEGFLIEDELLAVLARPLGPNGLPLNYIPRPEEKLWLRAIWASFFTSYQALWMTVVEAADRSKGRVKEATLYKRIERGQLPHRLSGKTKLVRWRDVEKYLELVKLEQAERD